MTIPGSKIDRSFTTIEVTGTTSDSVSLLGGITVAGDAAITGNATITGNMDLTGTLTGETVFITHPVDASSVDTQLFISTGAWQVVSVEEAHTVAGNDGGAVTIMVNKCTGTQAPSAGNATLTGTLDLKGAANTVQAGTLTATTADLQLADGDRLCADFTGTLTTLAGGVVTIGLQSI